jgi:mono/diheme cytochrome c family protein
MKRSLLAALAASLILAAPGSADQCQRQRVVVRSSGYAHTSYQTAYVVQPLYQVGSALREEAIAQRAAELALQSLLKQLQEQVPANQAMNPVVPATPNRAQSIFNQHCVRCHAGANAKAGLDLSNGAALTEAQKLKAAVYTYRGIMPPDGPIDSDDDATHLLDWATGVTK